MKQSSFFTTRPPEHASLAEIQTYLNMAQLALQSYPDKRTEVFNCLNQFAQGVEPTVAGDQEEIAKIHDRIEEIITSLKQNYPIQSHGVAKPADPEML